MATRGAIGVRIFDGVTDRTVTAEVTDLKFAKQANGGHSVASFTLTVPLGTFADLGPSDVVTLTDTRTGLILWSGYAEAPTPTSGPGGEAYAMAASGGMLRAADETRALVYVDTDLSRWEQYQGSSAATSANASVSSDPGTAAEVGGSGQGILVQFNPGAPVGPNQVAQMGYNTLEGLGMEVASVTTRFKSGKGGVVGVGYQPDLAYNPPSSFTPLGTQLSDTSQGPVVRRAGEHFPDGVTLVALRIKRTGGATNVADDLTWTFFDQISVVTRLLDRYGGRTPVDLLPSVTASAVAEDLLGRLLTFCDPTASTIEATTGRIDQLAYYDGVTAQGVLNDLVGTHEPDMLWEILHATDTGPTGRHVLNLRRWLTAPRYEISTADGYDESGSDTDLANRIAVTWTDKTGVTQVTTVTATSEQFPALRALELAGRTRDAEPAELPEGRGSEENAKALGATLLADANTLGTSATAVVRTPIRDLYTGRDVMPWEIEPGYPVRVRERGVDLRLTATEYDDDTCATTLQLGYPSKTRDQRLAEL